MSAAATQTALRVTRLVESNFKRIISANIEPGQKTLVVLRGKNEQGKTSAIDGLIAALAGGKASPDMPIHEGAESASVELLIGDAISSRYRITRSWTKGEKSYLNVYEVNQDGTQSKVSSPQTLLDSLVNDLSFDPLAFAKVACSNRATDREQAAKMLFAAIGRPEVPVRAKAKKDEFTEQRKQLNAQVRQLQAELAAAPDPCPGQELQAATDADLHQQLEQARKHNEARSNCAQNIANSNDAANSEQVTINDIDQQIADLQRKRLEAVQRQTGHRAAAAHAQQTLASMAPEITTEQLTAGLAKIRDHNSKVQQQQAHRTKAAKATELQKQADSLTANLDAVDKRVEDILAASDMGQSVPGLTFKDGELFHNGVPFSQASGMRRLELSALIGMAANPTLRILCVDEGDQLDDQSLQRLVQLAKERDYAVWMTSIRAGDEGDPDTHLVPVCEGFAKSHDSNAAHVAMINAAIAEMDAKASNAPAPTAPKPVPTFDPDDL